MEDGQNLQEFLTQKAREITGQEDYQFGDITRQAVANFTGKDVGEYEFGDITREVLRRREEDAESEELARRLAERFGATVAVVGYAMWPRADGAAPLDPAVADLRAEMTSMLARADGELQRLTSDSGFTHEQAANIPKHVFATGTRSEWLRV